MISLRNFHLSRSLSLLLGLVFVAGGNGCRQHSHTLPLEILYNIEEQPTEKMAVVQILQAQLAHAGIEVKLEPVSNTVFYDRLAKGQFESTFELWALDYNDAEGYLTDFYSKAGFRLSKYSSQEFDQLYLKGLFAAGEEHKLEAFHSAAAVLARDLPWIPLYSNDEVFLLQPGARAFNSNAYDDYDYAEVALPAIRAASDVEVKTLDPVQCYDLGSKHLISQSYEGLVALDADNRIVPSLATSWTSSPDQKMLTFQLRSHVLFQSSPIFTSPSQRELSSADVKASFERLIRSNSPYAYIFDYVQGVSAFKSGQEAHVKGFQTPSPGEFRIALDHPLSTMLPWLLAPAAYIVPKELPDQYDFSRGSVGTGPFVLKSFDGSTAQFVAYQQYWATGHNGVRLPIAKTLTIRVIKDANTQQLAFRQGALDVFNVPMALYPSIFDSRGNLRPDWSSYTLHQVPLANLKFLAFNMNNGPWGTDVALRRKVASALRPDVIVQNLFLGKAEVDHSIIPAGIPGFESR
jgi:ABC-type transport system substrate-binding protein